MSKCICGKELELGDRVMIRCKDCETKISDLEAKLTDLQSEQIKEMQEHQEAMQIADKRIKELEAKLAESEKKFIIANNLRKKSDEVLLNYKTEKYGLDKTIQELRKIKLSIPEKEWYYKGFENCERQMSSHIADLTLEVKELKQQLAEKDKQLAILEKALELAVGQLDDAKDMLRECGKHEWAGMIDTSADYFMARAKEIEKNE